MHIIGKPQGPTKEETQASTERVIRMTPAVIGVLEGASLTVGESIDVGASVTGNMLARAYPDDKQAALKHLDGIRHGILEVYEVTAPQVREMQKQQAAGARVQ